MMVSRLLFVAALSSPCWGSIGAVQGASLSLEAPSDLTLGEPVVLEYIIANESPHALRADMGWDRVGSFQYDLTTPSGFSQSTRPHATRDGGSRFNTGAAVRLGVLS